jgi:GT2 family glycosyltransferase
VTAAAEPERTLGEAVTVAYVHQNHVTYSWYHSMVELLGWDMANHGRVLQGGYIGMRHGSDGLVQARNQAVAHFLEDAKADWLFWIDTDMGFPADTIDRLLQAADPAERPVVGGLCFTQTEKTEDGMGGWRCHATPTIFDWAKLDDGQIGFAVRWDYPPNTLVQVGATGAACVLVHRSVFRRIEQAHGRIWYDRVPNTTTGQLLGEDLSFCLRAGALGIPMFVHTGIRTTHLKPVWLGDADYQQQRSNAIPAIPATAETAVLVPVLNRPQNAKTFMASLRASTGLAHVYAVCQGDDPDTATAWLDAGAEVLESGEQTSFAAKANLGYAKTSEPWLFLVGDDVRFHPGWLDHAQAVAGDRYHVVGTNDLGKPRVLAGEHATHLLIRRSYVDEYGASWDGPGVVAHEGYRHWFVDDEIVTAAKQRGVWAMALASKVEHLHPLWSKGEMDETYRLGQANAAADKEQFLQRFAAHTPEPAP